MAKMTVAMLQEIVERQSAQIASLSERLEALESRKVAPAQQTVSSRPDTLAVAATCGYKGCEFSTRSRSEAIAHAKDHAARKAAAAQAQ